jgi:putative PEP-CTERM system histidine kinase
MGVPVALTLWSYSLAALLFGALALSQVSRAGTALPRFAFLVALGATALWAVTIAGIGAGDVTSGLAEAARNIAWLAFMLALMRRGCRSHGVAAVRTVYGIVLLVVMVGGALSVIGAELANAASHSAVIDVATVLRMIVAVSALVLVNHLYQAVAPVSRDGIRLAVLALAVMWLVDLATYTLAYLGIAGGGALAVGRGLAMAAIAPLFALAAHRNGDWTLRLSRTVTYQSLSLVGVGLYLLVMVLATSAIAASGYASARILQTAFILGAATALTTFVSSPWLRAWTKVKLDKHLFTHRYDYRAEWVRFTDTLGQPGGAGAAALDQRIVKAVADLTDSPAGLLLVPDGAGLGQGASWNWQDDGIAGHGGAAPLVAWLQQSARIIELDAVRDGSADAAELAAVPQWMVDRADAWVLVPLVHFGALTGAILLTRPPVDRRPDWEDLDLLRIAGRQVASYLAEARAQHALAEAQRFEEFNRRFAFILHDIKNLVSQQTLVARNAERHADNPEFRADMIATLKESATRMNDLLARLSQHHGSRAEAIDAVAVMPLIQDAAVRRRAQHPVVTSGQTHLYVRADAARLAQLLDHLVQNAVEASQPGDPVTVVASEADGAVAIDVIDHGCGMSPGFVRDQLFKPFVSSKATGFGLGAFEARQLVEAMGGSVTVSSREGEGTRFRVTLPRAEPQPASMRTAA